jgi:biopolymer transport protein ExbD
LPIIAIGCDNHVVTLNPNLPTITTLPCNPNVDSCFFNIEVKGARFLIKDAKHSLLFQNTEELQSFIKEEVADNKIDRAHGFNVALSLDSKTPFSIVDRLIEELQLIGIYRLYFKCKNTQVALYFSPENDEIRQIVVQMYSSRFKTRDELWKQFTQEISKSPPPPPLPLPIPLYYASKSKKDSEQAELAVVEHIGNVYKVNGEFCDKEGSVKAIYNKRNVFIKLSANNTYREMMEVVDLINHVQRQKFNDQSQLRFKKNYCDLDQETWHELRSQFGIAYSILTLAEQKYIASFPVTND